MYIGEYKVLDIEYDELMGLASHYKSAYSSNSPFPNIYFDDFFNSEFLSLVLSEFPDMGNKGDIEYTKRQMKLSLLPGEKIDLGRRQKSSVHFLNSEPFFKLPF